MTISRNAGSSRPLTDAMRDESSDTSPTSARPLRMALGVVLSVLAVVLLAFAALVVGRSIHRGAIPGPPRDASELGPMPQSDAAWAPLLDEFALAGAVDDETVRELLYRMPSRTEVRAVMERRPAPAFRALDESIDRWFVSPLVDGCTDPFRCVVALSRGTDAVEVMAVYRWARGDVTGASRLLEAFLRSTVVTARTARSESVQSTALSGLAEILRVLRDLDARDRHDAAEARVLTPTLADFVAELADLDVDLWRPWIAEMQVTAPELATFQATAQPRTRFFIDAPSLATELYASYESCIRAARSGAPIDGSMSVHVPTLDDEWFVAEEDGFALAGLEGDCGRLLEGERYDLEHVHDDAHDLATCGSCDADVTELR